MENDRLLLQRIVLPEYHTFYVPELCYHCRTLPGDMFQVDFDGYLNLFYIEKHRKYTALTDVYLELKLEGWDELLLMQDRNILQTIPLQKETEEKIHIEFPYQKAEKGVFWFTLRRRGSKESLEVTGVSGGIYGVSSIRREVNLAVDICTFRREAYVQRNLQLILEQVLRSPWEAGKHICVFLADNGNTLSEHKEIQALVEKSEGRFRVFPNHNTGGAGGFTRGMLEVLRWNEETKDAAAKEQAFTHILVMDDDATIHPELFFRLYGFLACLKEEYRELRIGGAMMREDFPWIKHVCGEIYHDFRAERPEQTRDMRAYENCVTDQMLGTDGEYMQYSGWWCCCYAVSLLEKKLLSLPFFIRYDDMSFERARLSYGIVFLNGIHVWHRGFELTFAGANTYYDVRNGLIHAAVFEPEQKLGRELRWLLTYLFSMIAEYRYAEAELVIRGLSDYLKGPEWLYQTDPDILQRELGGFYKEKSGMRDWTELHLPRKMVAAMERYRDSFCEKQIMEHYTKTSLQKHRCKLLTLNGWLLPARHKVRCLSALDSRFRAYRMRAVVLYEPFSGKACIAKKDYREFSRILVSAAMTVLRFLCCSKKVSKNYRDNLQQISGREAWESYLGL